MKIEDVESIVIPEDLEDVMSEMRSVDGFSDAVHIYDKNLQTVLEAMGIVRINTRGSCFPGVSFKEFYEMDIEDLEKSIAMFCRGRGISAKKRIVTYSYVELT